MSKTYIQKMYSGCLTVGYDIPASQKSLPELNWNGVGLVTWGH